MTIINSQLGGKKPTGTKNITANGTHNVADYAYADVQVPKTAPDYYITKSKTGTTLTNGNTFINLTNITDVDNNVLYGAYYHNSNITGILDLSSFTALTHNYSLQSMCARCNLTGVNLSNLSTVSGTQPLYETFLENYNLTTVDLTNLTSVTGNFAITSCFSGCNQLTTLIMPNLTTVTGTSALGGAFRSTKLGTFVFEKLSILTGANALQRAFGYATISSLSFPALTSSSFGSATSQFNNMLQGVTGCTVHFPSNLQSVIGSWADVLAGFGGTNTTILYDLSATE